MPQNHTPVLQPQPQLQSEPAAAAALTFYSRGLFHLSPVFKTWAKLTAHDIHNLQERPGFEGHGIYFYLNHPIRWVRLVGVVVSFEKFEEQGRVLIHLDDGSSRTIQLVYFEQRPDRPSCGRFALPKNALPINFRTVDVGTVLKAKGEVSEFRDTRQITLRKIELINDTNAEVEAWKVATAFKRDLLLKPWVISNEAIEKEKRKRHEQFIAERASKKARLPWTTEESASGKRDHRGSSAGTIVPKEKSRVFYGKRREKRPNDLGIKIKREQDVEIPTMGSIRELDKSGPELDTVADRQKIQEILQQREDLELAAVIAGKKVVYPTTDRKKIGAEGGSRHVSNVQYFSAASKIGASQFEPNSSSAHDQGKSKREVYQAYERYSNLSFSKQNGCIISSKLLPIGRSVGIKSIETTPSPALSRSPQPPPEIYTHRSLKLLILSHIHTAPMPNFTISSLRLTPKIEAHATKVAQAQNPQVASTTSVITSGLIFKAYCDVLQTLVDDGNLIRVQPYSSYAYAAVGKWNLGDLIQEAIDIAKAQALRKLERKKLDGINQEAGVVEIQKKTTYGANTSPVGRVAVRSIWLKTQARGGGWEGVTKGVVAEVVREVLEEQGEWKDVGRGLWEWEAVTEWSYK